MSRKNINKKNYHKKVELILPIAGNCKKQCLTIASLEKCHIKGYKRNPKVRRCPCCLRTYE